MNEKLDEGVREATDRAAITELVYRYAYGHNEDDAAVMNSCFTDDAVFVVEGHERKVSEVGLGTPQPPAVLRKATGLDQVDVATTSMTNVSIKLDGDTATVDCVALTNLVGRRDDAPAMRMRAIRLHDDAVRRDGEWKFARRSHDLLWAFEPARVTEE